MRRLHVCSFFIISVALVAIPAFTQRSLGESPHPNAPAPQHVIPPEYGTTSRVDYVIGAWEFQPYVSAATPLTTAGGAERSGGAGFGYDAPAHLPSGALVVGLEIQGCDNSAVSHINAQIYRVGINHVSTSVASANSTDAGTGCDYFGNFAITPFTVDNFLYTYDIEIIFGNNADSISGIRIYYKLQVSPAPVTATFSDVPTSHPFFQFIEALAASGITSGCTAPPNPNYCPNDPLTRGQMAVFLSRALGLHFPD